MNKMNKFKKITIKTLVGISFVGLLIMNLSINNSEFGGKFKLIDLANIALADNESIESGVPSTFITGYYNATLIIYNHQGSLGLEVGEFKLPVNVSIQIGASGSLNYCHVREWYMGKDVKCYTDRNGFTPFY